MSGHYYNENDPSAAAWLRQLIADKLIPAGDIDTRSISFSAPIPLADSAFGLSVRGRSDIKPKPSQATCNSSSFATRRFGNGRAYVQYPKHEIRHRIRKPSGRRGLFSGSELDCSLEGTSPSFFVDREIRALVGADKTPSRFSCLTLGGTRQNKATCSPGHCRSGNVSCTSDKYAQGTLEDWDTSCDTQSCNDENNTFAGSAIPTIPFYTQCNVAQRSSIDHITFYAATPMKKWHYYNDNDPSAIAWTKQLIKDGLVPDGEVDERSISDVQPSDLKDFIQCHFFCGICGWPEALRLAGWSTTRPVWTNSCPCQPFSAAGKQKGNADARHLWPEMSRLIRECRPSIVIGEQVESAVRHGWLDGVFADLEAEGYACGAIVLGAHSVGAPHIRQRLYWVADAELNASESRRATDESRQGYTAQARGASTEFGRRSHIGRMADADGAELQGFASAGEQSEREQNDGSCGLGNANGARRERRSLPGCECIDRSPTGATGGEVDWSDYILIPCRDGKQRRTQPGISPLVAGLPRSVVRGGDQGAPINPQASAEARVMRLRGYGNAINARLAATFIECALEVA